MATAATVGNNACSHYCRSAVSSSGFPLKLIGLKQRPKWVIDLTIGTRWRCWDSNPVPQGALWPFLTSTPVIPVGWYTDSHRSHVYQMRHNMQVAINPDTSL